MRNGLGAIGVAPGRLERGKDPHEQHPEETGPIVETDDTGIQPLRDGDTSMTADPADDPAQAEWDRTTLLDEGVSPDRLDGTTATDADPDEIAVR